MDSGPVVVPASFSYLRPVERIESVAIEDALKVYPRGRWPWLQRLLFRSLKRLGAIHPVREVAHWETVRVNFDSIVDGIFANHADMMRIYQKQARYIVVGRDRMPDMMTATDAGGRYLMVDFPAHYESTIVVRGVQQRRMFAGLTVIFVPWIEGLFVLPGLEDAR